MQNLQSLQANRGSNLPNRTPSPSSQLFNYITSLPGLVAYYPMNETTGNAINYAPATLGSLSGVNTAVLLNQPGKVGSSYQYNGSTSKTIVANNSALNLTGAAITVGMLINFTAANTNARNTAKANDDIVMNLEDDDSGTKKIRFLLKLSDDSSPGVQTNVGVPLSTWFWIIGCYNGVSIRTFINNTQQSASSNQTLGLKGSAGALGIGAQSDGNNVLSGYLQHYFISSQDIGSTAITKLSQIAGLV